METRSTLIEAPTAEPLTLADVKLDRAIDHDLHDALFNQYIQAARELAESATGRALMPQTWQHLVARSGYEIALEKWPALDLVSVTVNGAAIDHEALLESGELEFYPGDNPLLVSRLFGGARVVVRYRAGYVDAGKVPASIKKWMMLKIGSFYEHRESEIVGSTTSNLKYVDGLIRQFRVIQ